VSEAPDDRDSREEEAPEERSAGAQMSLSVVIVSVFLFFGKFAGYVKEGMLSDYWGLSGGLDAFKVVYNSIIVLVYTKVEKLLRPTFLPIFVEHREAAKGQRAWNFLSTITNITLIAMLGVSTLAVVFAPSVIDLWPGLSAANQDLAANLLRIAGFAMALLVMSVMAELTLHSYKRFTVPALAEAVMRVVLPVSIAGLIAWWGMEPVGPDGGLPNAGLHSAAIGVLIGAALRLLVQLPALWGKLRMYRFRLDLGNPDVRRMFVLIPPVIVGLVFSAARTFFDSRFATDIDPGLYSALDFARKISDAPILILPMAVSLVVYPFVSEWASRQNREMFTKSLVSMTRVMAFIFVPMAVGLIVLSVPAIRLLCLGKGAFQPEDTYVVQRALIPYAAGIPFFAVEGSINKWFFALGDTATPNYIGAMMAVLHVAIAWFGVYRLRRSVGVIALALTASKSLKVIVLYGLLRRRLEPIGGREVLSFALRLLTATALMGAAVWLVYSAMQSMVLSGGRIQSAIALMVCGVSGVGVYLVAAWMLKIEEVGMVVGYVREKIAKKFGGK
jgi:putative peptidoglycan lipid II flippase